MIDCKIDKLPTELGKICKANGIQIKKNSMLEQDKLLPNERGKTHYIDGKCFIIVRSYTKSVIYYRAKIHLSIKLNVLPLEYLLQLVFSIPWELKVLRT